MNPTTKRLLMSILNYITIFAMLLNFLFPVADLASSVNAQDVTEEPVATEAPTTEVIPATEAATEVPSEAPPTADTATDTPSDVITEEPTTAITDEPTAVITEEPTAIPTEAPNTLIFLDDFPDATTDGWLLTSGWQIVSEPDNYFLSTSAPNETATIMSVTPADFALSARVRIAWGNKASIVFRAGIENYTLTLDTLANTATLYRGATVLGQAGLIVPAADEVGQVPLVWYPVTILASGDSINVTVDNITVASIIDPAPLAAGAIIFTTDAANTGSVSIDDVAISQVIPAVETPVASETVVVTETLLPTEEATVVPDTTEEPAGQRLLTADFENELIGWTLGTGTSIIAENENNHALLLTANAQLDPTESIFLADFQLDARFHILSDAADGTASGLSIPFRTQDGHGYVLSIEAGQTTLSRYDGETLTPIAISPTIHALNTWNSLSLEARGGHLVITINGLVEIDVTEAEPLMNGQISFIANNASNVMLDDISITDFSGAVLIAATPEPFSLSDEERAKLPSAMLEIIDLFLKGDEAGALAQAQTNLVPMDETGRIHVVVWAAEGVPGSALSDVITTVGGTANFVYDTTVEAHVPLSSFLALVNTPEVAAISLASGGTSTSIAGAAPVSDVLGAPTGPVVGEGFDIISANDWHEAAPTALTGAGQRILLIDTGTGGHAAKVAEVLDDVAPNSIVTIVTASTIAQVNSAVAGSGANNIILITMDLGVNVSPGDGTGTNTATAATLYATLAAQRAAGKLIIASAGNNNWWTDGNNDRIGRYFTMTYNNGGGGTISIPVSAQVGDVIRVSWNDWNDALNGSNRENFDVRLSSRPAVPILDAVGLRGATLDPSAVSTPITAVDCPTQPCSLTLTIGGANGSASFGDAGSVVFQVQISGEGTLNASDMSGATVNFTTGNIARPADSPDVVAVGAVCARASLNYPILPESSVGPIFTTGGNGPASSTPNTRTGFKPDLVGPSDVSVTGSIVGDAPSGNACDEFDTNGFSGTSAAAAYIAGMAALIQQNGNINVRPTAGWDANAIFDYLQSHSIDLPRNDAGLGTIANGFDMRFGSGLAVLGDPSPTAPINPMVVPDGPAIAAANSACSNQVRYVSPGNVGSGNLGGLGGPTNPFIHPADALADAPANSCVILLPGEYVSGIHVDDNNPDGIKLRSYKSILQTIGQTAADSIFWANNGMSGGEGAIAIRSNSLSVEGFIFKPSNPSNLCAASASEPVSFPRPIAIKIDQSTGNVIRNNTISGFRVGIASATTCNTGASAPLQIGNSNNVLVQGNTFTGNMVQTAAAITVANSGDISSITIERNVFKSNVASSADSSNPACELAVVRIDFSVTNLYNNRFFENGTCVMLRINDGSAFNNPDDQSGAPVVVFGNVFSRNTNFKPIVQLIPGRRFRFINNTVAGNKNIPNDLAIIMRGEANGNNGGGQIDIHNNIFYDNNRFGSLFLDISGDLLCFSNDQTPTLDPNAGQGARNNWSYDSGTSAGDCGIPFANPALNNSINLHNPFNPFDSDPSVAEVSEFVGATLGGDDAYRLKAIAFAVGYADDTNAVFGFNPGLLSGFDAFGDPRLSGLDGLDVGAYEYKPVTGGVFNSTYAEDFIEQIDTIPSTPAIDAPILPVIKVPLTATGGFPPYTFEIATNPANYSTDLSNYCGGLPVRFDQSTDPPSVYYCPPRHFYNQGLGSEAAISFSYRVTDQAGNVSDPAIVNLTLTPVANDTNLQTEIGTAANPYTIVGVLTSPPTPIDFRLRPYTRFGNFRISAPGNALLPPSSDGLAGALQADYPYTYSSINFPAAVCPPPTPCPNPNLFPAGHINAQFNAIGANGGVLRLTPVAGQTGYAYFTYDAEDSRGNTTTNHVRVLVVGDLPDSGLHDDTSFTWNYYGVDLTQAGAWTPIYNEVSINNTLHTTTALNDTAEFLFDGVGFALYMAGSSSGGSYELRIENGGIPVSLGWGAVPGVAGTFEARNGAITCRTTATAIRNPATDPAVGPFSWLTNLNSAQALYAVSCNGFLDGEANKVIVVNKQAGRQLRIDAIGILQNSSPLLPGFHEVTEAQMLPLLFGYTQVVDTRASGGRTATTSSVNGDISFSFTGGHGFSIGTALQKTALAVAPGQPLGVQYRICVADILAPNNKLCQRYDNGVGATTAPVFNVFRPFYGFDPLKTYQVTIDIINVPNYSGAGAAAVPLKFYLDSIVIFDSQNQPTTTLPLGVTEDDAIGTVTFGGGLPDTWLFNSNSALASNKSLTSIITTVPKVGPFISFIVPPGADTVNWTQNGTANTTQALICVDRARLTLTNGDIGNCIVMNTRTGTYLQMQANGLLINDPTPITSGINPITISQEMFRLPWGTGAPHIIEISSLTNEAFNLDKVQIIDADAPLSAGYFEENSTNLRWFTETQVPSASFDLRPVGDDGNFTDLVSSPASGGRVKILTADSNPTLVGNDKENLREGMFFQFNGTGFSVYFTLDPRADAVRLCWRDDGGSPATPTSALINTVLTTGTCQTFDNQSAAARYRAARTIAGLQLSNYSVVVQMLDDQAEPAPHTVALSFLTMQIDAVQVYNNTIPNVLSVVGQKYETSFTKQATDGLFSYLGTGWRSVNSTLYSGGSYDTLVNVIGAGVTFRTNNGSNVVIYRDTRSSISPMQVCVNRVSPVQRRCTIIVNNGASGGYQQPITVPLFDTTEHVVSIITTDAGTFNLDAIQVTNTPLQPGIYDENNPALVYSTTTDLQKPIYSNWKDVTLTSYTGGGGMETSAAGASVSFEFEGTGFSLITLFDTLSTNLLNITICQGNCGTGGNDFNFTGATGVSNNQAAVRYGASHSFAGLPFGQYTATITEAGTGTKHKVVIDGVEVYGFPGDPTYYDPLRELQPGFYDNAAVIANGSPYLTFGPNNGTWAAQTGTTAGTALNQTRHFTNRFGATASFEIQNADSLTLYHGGSTTTKLQVCAVQVGTFTRRCNTDTASPIIALPQTLVGRLNTTYSDPYLFPAGVGNYYVSITNMAHGLNLYIDALVVQNASVLTEGIYEERHPGLAFAGGPGTWIANPVAEALGSIDKFVRSTQVGASSGQTLTFSFRGIGFSIIIAESTATSSNNYSLCVDQGTSIGTCTTINSNPLVRENTTTGRKPVALTYVGFNPGQTYTVRLTNNDNTKALLVDRVDVLGALTSGEQIDDTITGSVENTDPRIVFFPFSTFKKTANTLASGGNQGISPIQGSIAYFELDNVPGAGRTIEYVRQTLSSYSQTRVCSAPLNTLSTNADACTNNVEVLPANPILNTVAPVGYQKSQSITIDGNNDDRWVILRNVDGKPMPVDFVRQVLPGLPLTAGQYDDNHIGLRWFTEQDEAANPGDPLNGQIASANYTLLTAGDFGNFTNVLSTAHYGGGIRVLSEDFDPATTPLPVVNDHLNLYEGMFFQFTGTGFGVGFSLNTKADGVKICWVEAQTTNINTILAGTCQTYDNQSAAIRNQAFRTILGLTQGTYSVAVQMLPDNNQPAAHVASATPITMQIDSVKVYDDVLPTPVLNSLSVRYETSFASSTTNRSFLYYGTGWTSVSGTAARLYSGMNYDRIVNQIGAGVTFLTDDANAITIYRDTRAGYSPIEVCAQRTASPFTRTCTVVSNSLATGTSVPIPVMLNNSGNTSEHLVSITTLDAGTFVLDAVQLMNTNAPLTAGKYEDTHPGLKFTNSTGANNGGWVIVANAAYSGARSRQTTGIGDVLDFSFTGTGFEVSMGIDRFGGEVKVCYDTNSNWADGTNKCFIYQNEAIAGSNLVTRSVAGLASNTYFVRVQHVEDGNTVIGVGGTRLATYNPSRLRIDYVTIFNNALPPTITQGGMYNENASSGGIPYLQLLPAERWNAFSGTVAAAFSGQSYVGTVDNLKRLVSTYAGPVAVMRVQVPAGGATVIVYTGPVSTLNSDKVLVCANDVNADAPTLPNVSNETSPGPNCTVINTSKTSNQFILNSSKLGLLGGAGTVTLTFRNLTPGQFRIDGFQIIHGNVLSPGLYDDFLFSVGDPFTAPSVLIGLNAAGTTVTPGQWITAPSTLSKLASAYGGTQALAVSTNATTDDPTLRFKFVGTGFSIITTADSVGADFRVCYAAMDNGAAGFDGTLDGVYGPTNSVEFCDTATTDTVPPVATNWNNFNNSDPKPTIAYQYGLTYTGLRADPGPGADNSYVVEVRLTDTILAATDRLKIDAIAIFSDVTAGNPPLQSAPSGQVYDDRTTGIIYEPSVFWKQTTTTTGPTTGPWNRTQTTTTNAGGIVQLNITGNGVIIYQTAGGTGSRKVRVCIATPLGPECTEYAQSPGTVKYFSPIAFYGFGTGTHQLVIDNRDPGRPMSIDGIRVLP